MRPGNDNFTPDAPIRLADILPMAFPYGGITVAGLRKEASRGRLTIMRIANKDFTTLDCIEEMKTKCRVPANQQGSGSDRPTKIAHLPGSSSMAEGNTALAAANLIVQRLSAR